MGDIARVADDEVEFTIDVAGSAPIERLDIYDGLDLIETVRPYAAANSATACGWSTRARNIAGARGRRPGTAPSPCKATAFCAPA